MRVRSGLALAALVAACSCLMPASAYPLPEGTPEEMNLSREKLDRITAKLERLSARQVIPGASFVVVRGGKRVYTGNAGHADISTGLPYTPDTLVRLMSQTKPITAVAVMILVEEGKLALTDELIKFNPNFANMQVESEAYINGDEGGPMEPLKRNITIYDLLSFTSGVSYSYDFVGDLEGPIDFPEFSPFNLLTMSRMNIDELADQIARVPLVCQPGEYFYYGWSYDLLGYVVHKVTGQGIDVFYHERIFKPLQMFDTSFYVPSDKMNRFAAQYTGHLGGGLSVMVRPRADPLQGYRTPRLLMGGAGVISTANDYMLFAQMLLNGGELNGVRILKSETVDLMWRNHLKEDMLPYSLNGWTSDPETGYGLGLSITCHDDITTYKWDKHTGGGRICEVGWGGGASTNWQASADHDLVVTYSTQLLDGPGTEVFFETVWKGVVEAITGPSPRALPGPVPPATPKKTPKIRNPEGNDQDRLRKEKKLGNKEEDVRRKLRTITVRPF